MTVSQLLTRFTAKTVEIRDNRSRAYGFACVALALFAVGFNWATGHRGVSLLDQSMVFDGAWRILRGETPYKDFLIPFGPMTFYIQAAFFGLLGVNWSAMVVSACVLNAAATLSAIRVVRLLTANSRVLALCAGFSVALSFQAPFGTLWMEQTALFFSLLSLQFAVESFGSPPRLSRLWRALAGVLLVAAVISKQNFGVIFAPIPIAVLIVKELPDVRRAVGAAASVLAGAAAGAAAFVLWLVTFSDAGSFVRNTVLVAGSIGRSRLGGRALIDALCFQTTPNRFNVDVICVLAGILAILLWGADSQKRHWKGMAPGCVAMVLLPWFRSFTQASTLNNWQNNIAFVGLTLCIGAGVFWRLLDLPRRRKICLLALPALWGMALMAYEGRAAWHRSVHDFPHTATFREPVRVPGMERLLWGDPTPLGGDAALRRREFENVAAYLARKREPFFVMGDSLLLYGLLGARSPQPLLYFQPHHSYRQSDIPALDRMISSALDRSSVRIVVREKVTFLREVHDSYAEFPRTWGWFTGRFVHAFDFGNYEIWEWRRGNLP